MPPRRKLPHLLALAVAAVIVAGLVLSAPSWRAGSLDIVQAALPTPSPAPPPAVGTPVRSSGADALGITATLSGLAAPDPFVVVEGDQPWLFTTNTFAGNVPVITPNGQGGVTVVDALPVLPAWAEAGFTWGPAVIPTAHQWVLAFTARDRASGLQCIGVATAAVLAGPYAPTAAPLVCDADRGGAIDPSFVGDDNGHLWLLYKDDGNCCGLPTALKAAPLSPDGTALAGPPVEILRADQPWEDDVVEAPTMTQVGDRWLLLYSASRWDHAGYAVGAAWCQTPSGPCTKQPDPALSLGAGLDGPGGLEFVFGAGLGDDQLPVAFHAWPNRPHGYDDGSVRQLHLGQVTVDGDLVTISPLALARPG